MKFLKRDKSQSIIQDKAANGIANGILKSQRWFAGNLERVTKKWKQKQQWVFLYLVCLLFGGLSIAAVVNAFKVSATSKTIIPKSITVPQNIYQENNPFLITENELKQVQEYKKKYPNLFKERPGLWDSLTLIEQSYYSQKKITP